MRQRFEIANRAEHADHRAESFRQGLLARGITEARVWELRYVDVIWLESDVTAPWEEALGSILLDRVLHEKSLHLALNGIGLEKRLLPGMTDNRARTLVEGLRLQIPNLDPARVRIRTGEMVVITNISRLPLSDHPFREMLKPWWTNPVIQEFQIHSPESLQKLNRYEAQEVNGLFAPLRDLSEGAGTVERFPLNAMSPAELMRLSQSMTLALNEPEMLAIQQVFRDRPCTDVELEVIAQTWSEHCQHKLFGAEIDYRTTDAHDPAGEIPAKISGLFKHTIRQTTADLPRPWLLSVFSDNAGIVQMSPTEAVCLKVETHNSPSALDPFGGAITGIVGVNRDILGCGLGAKPIANLDVFCVAPPLTPNPMPEKIIAPEVILEGIRAGVEAGEIKVGFQR